MAITIGRLKQLSTRRAKLPARDKTRSIPVRGKYWIVLTFGWTQQPMPKPHATAPSDFDSTVQVAKITSRQPIIIALITSLAGVLRGIIGHFSTKAAFQQPIPLLNNLNTASAHDTINAYDGDPPGGLGPSPLS